LLLNNFGFIRSIAREFSGGVKERADDLAQSGIEGFFDAIQNYEPGHNASLLTYSRARTALAIRRRLTAERFFATPPKIAANVRKIQAIEGEGERLTAEEIQAKLGVTARHAREVRAAADARLVSLDLPFLGNDDPLADAIVDPSQDTALAVAEAEMHRIVQNAVLRLNDRQREAVSRYFGLDGGERQTLRQIANHLGISPEYARQIVGKALKRLRDLVKR
jgi:RNA polymerase sigma factor (sigma-70 family)